MGMEAFLPEDYIVDSPAVSDIDQERDLLRNSDIDLIIALDNSVGVLGELASFENDPEIVKKSFILYPAENYNPVTYAADIVQQYWNRMSFSREELERCDLVTECEERAKAFRKMKWQGSPARQF